MFKFAFLREDKVKEDVNTIKSVIDWIPASKVQLSESQIEKEFKLNDYVINTVFPDCELKLIRFEKALQDLTNEDCINIKEAESQHSDLIPAKYEGGLKIWECSYDLGRYILENDIKCQGKVVLDLGCGTGIIGLIALLKNSVVHFQDYNVEVINTVTIPNVLLNSKERKKVLQRCEFFCGDWESFIKLNDDKNEVLRYDFIFTSETIYNPDNHRKLYEVFKEKLQPHGVGFVAAKSYYFGVGGGIRQFQSLIEQDGIFDVEIAWKSQQGLQREILKLSRKQHQ